MRQIISLNQKWFFRKNAGLSDTLPLDWYIVNLPHTYNAIDGQDGNGDYYRGKATYMKEIFSNELPEADRYYLEICGANSCAEVYWNGKLLQSHDGGYAAWRVDVTDELRNHNLLGIITDNGTNDRCYPQNADFTFYGGLYRDVRILAVSQSHFDLDYYGGRGLKVMPVCQDGAWTIQTDAYLSGARPGQELRLELADADGQVVAAKSIALTSDCLGAEDGKPSRTSVSPADAKDQAFGEPSAFEMTLAVPAPHLWHGRRDPYLYTVTTYLTDKGDLLDAVSCRVGLRTFSVDPELGFILNGEAYPLRGVARHQDKWGVGNALSHEDMEQDMNLILEGGFTTIRLAHYQHDQYFYDLCDQYGLVIWAEIPYITTHMMGGRANTIQQMTELIVQNHHHASICVWGLSNEINSGLYSAEVNEDCITNHKILNDLCHTMDPTRLTTMAIVSTCPLDHPYITIPDLVSWNHYFGWYQGSNEEYGPWFDHFHELYPNLPVGVSEYGCEAPMNWHSAQPEAGDYTEEYQALYHEACIRQLYTRPYIWATHVWNMFDFGADGRNEGGENGQNHKGLVDFRRKYKKDAFYAYKAWLSKEPFVHLCGKRYVNRAEAVTHVTVYSNLPEVALYVNGSLFECKTAEDHFFKFEVPLTQDIKLQALAGDYSDSSFIHKVDTPDPSYVLQDKGAVLNWWDITEPKGMCSLNTRLSIISKSGGAAMLAEELEKRVTSPYPLSAIIAFDDNFSVMRMIGLMGFGPQLSKEDLLYINEKLNQIPQIL